MIGIGINYVPLAAYAVALGGPDRLTAELSRVETARETRRYGVLQLWILVPFALLVLALVGSWPRRSGRR
jgi:hypothetical protein